MALTNSRPLSILTSESEIIHNSKSPLFHANSLGDTLKQGIDDKVDFVTRNDSNISSPRLNKSTSSEDVELCESPFKSIPVIGKRPKPCNKQPPLDDDVLFAIFVLLWEKDPDEKGMTVKQLCDYLLEKHPNMSTLSTKLSNLVSAKLNAYVKKVEKGETTLVYALSREWSYASPRRMVYVYRGIINPNHHVHTSCEKQKPKSSKGKKSPQITSNNTSSTLSNNHSTLSVSSESKSNGNITRISSTNAFSLSTYDNEYNIPYYISPVSMSLSRKTPELCKSLSLDSDGALKRKMNYDSCGQVKKTKRLDDGVISNYITAAAAAPRLSKIGSTNAGADSVNVSAIVSSIHKAVITQIPIRVNLSKSSSDMSKKVLNLNKLGESKIFSINWLNTIRNGFLTQEIDSPEKLSVDALDELFQ